MDKSSERINRQTLEFANRIYEELSTIICHREDLRYFNYDNKIWNDLIDTTARLIGRNKILNKYFKNIADMGLQN